MNKKKAVVALGHKALGITLPEQKIAAHEAAASIADLIENGYELVISHSNAPQVGMIHTAMNEFAGRHPEFTAAPMSVCSAMSQGYIGYDLQNSIREELLNRGIYKTVSTVLTQVEVDPYDEAFYNPEKRVGRFMDKEEAELEEKKGNYVTEVPEKGYQRIVAAPKPKNIIEIDAIKALLDAGQVVIAAGGGGIPVLAQRHHLKGASAVIEKDAVSALIAERIDADVLIILTAVEKAALNYGKPNEQWLDQMTSTEARKYIEDGQFAPGSMLPKIEAAVEFVEEREGRTALITMLDKAVDSLDGKTGTRIVKG